MKRLILPAFGLVAALSLGPVAALADSIFEVENARANARAGGPTDTELLRRWGTLSGTPTYNAPRRSTSKQSRRADHYRGRRR